MIVLGASFLVKLVLEENGSEEARNLARSWAGSGRVLATVDLALPEALNTIWKHSLKISDLSQDEAIDSAKDLLRAWATLKVYPSEEVAEEALKLALKEGITAYDALYIQLAKPLRANLATFDKKLSKTAIKHGIATHP